MEVAHTLNTNCMRVCMYSQKSHNEVPIEIWKSGSSGMFKNFAFINIVHLTWDFCCRKKGWFYVALCAILTTRHLLVLTSKESIEKKTLVALSESITSVAVGDTRRQCHRLSIWKQILLHTRDQREAFFNSRDENENFSY